MLDQQVFDRLLIQIRDGVICGFVTRNSANVPVLVHGQWNVIHDVDDGDPVSPLQAAQLIKVSPMHDVQR